MEDAMKIITNEVETGLEVITEASATIQKLFHGVQELLARLQECSEQSYYNAFVSFATVIAKMISQRASIPGEIAEQVSKAGAFVAGFELRVTNSTLELITKFKKEVERIATDMKDFIQNYKSV